MTPNPEPLGHTDASHGDPGVETSAKTQCCLRYPVLTLAGISTPSSATLTPGFGRLAGKFKSSEGSTRIPQKMSLGCGQGDTSMQSMDTETPGRQCTPLSRTLLLSAILHGIGENRSEKVLEAGIPPASSSSVEAPSACLS